MDTPRGRRPFPSSGERSGRGRGFNDSRGDEGRREGSGNERGGREGGFGERSREGGFADRGDRGRDGGFGDRGRDGGFGDRGREGGYGDRGRDGGYGDRGQRFGRREHRSANPQTVQRRTVHYQVVTMDDEEWGDALEHRLNSLGHEGWRLVAIDEGRQYVFVQAE